MEEIEAKWLKINPEDIQVKLKKLGGEFKYDRVCKDRVFDFPGWPLDKNKSWLRLRDKGDKVTLSFKKRFGKSEAGDAGMEETEIEVNNFENTSGILEKIGMVVKFNQEKRRIHWEINKCDVEIDYYPLISPYLEIEGISWKAIQEMAEKLGLMWKERKQFSGSQVFDVYGIDVQSYKIFCFDKQEKRI